jgi:hypothetical protein
MHAEGTIHNHHATYDLPFGAACEVEPGAAHLSLVHDAVRALAELVYLEIPVHRAVVSRLTRRRRYVLVVLECVTCFLSR